MTALWESFRTWLTPGRLRAATNPRLLQQIADAASRLRAGRNDRATHPADPMQRVVAVLAEFVVAVEDELGQSPYDVQLLAAAAMAEGTAVEMQTGEGKTLAAAAAATLLARQNRRVHVATVNRYLAQRDYERFTPVFLRMGIPAGLIHEGQSPDSKRQAYACPIVYGTGYEFGFDYLREQLQRLRRRTPKLGERYRAGLAPGADKPLQPLLDCILIDELDSVLLDEACVPLILSERAPNNASDLALLARAEELSRTLLDNRLAVVDGLTRTIRIRDEARTAIEAARPRNREVHVSRPWPQYVEHAIAAAALLQRDVDYVVADRKVWFVDSGTGRIFADRRWSDGLQQALEFKERLPLSLPTQASARITRQRFFKLYRTRGGTSGTLAEAADEIYRSYDMPVRIVAPRLPSQRKEPAARYFPRHLDRLRAAAEDAADSARAGRPVLVGCRTVAAGREAAQALRALGVSHLLLDGTQSEDEARIIAQAGRAGNVTVATNIAGRGTDIRLDEPARRAGGLHVVGLERHDSARIDRQLLGRAGRQGDPGSGRFFVSADDALLRPFPEATAAFRNAIATAGESHVRLSSIVAECQAALEAEARLRRQETVAADRLLDELLATLAKPE